MFVEGAFHRFTLYSMRKKPRDAESLLLQVIKKTQKLFIIDKFIKIYNMHFCRHVRFWNLDA